MLKVKEIAKKAGKETKDRLDPRTTGGIWAKIRNIASIIAGVGGGLLLIPVMPTVAIPYIQAVTIISSALAGGANLDKSKIKRLIKNKSDGQ